MRTSPAVDDTLARRVAHPARAHRVGRAAVDDAGEILQIAELPIPLGRSDRREDVFDHPLRVPHPRQAVLVHIENRPRLGNTERVTLGGQCDAVALVRELLGGVRQPHLVRDGIEQLFPQFFPEQSPGKKIVEVVVRVFAAPPAVIADRQSKGAHLTAARVIPEGLDAGGGLRPTERKGVERHQCGALAAEVIHQESADDRLLLRPWGNALGQQ